jgi:hypothetical protein
VTESLVLCQVCAWRGDCKKKYHLEAEAGKTICPDFCRDLTLSKEEGADEGEA